MPANERLTRRDFARLLSLSGSAALFPLNAFATPGRAGVTLAELGLSDAPLPRTPAEPDENSGATFDRVSCFRPTSRS